MAEDTAATPATGTAPEGVSERHVSRDERQSVDYAAARIAGLIGAETPTDQPRDATPASDDAPDEGSTAAEAAESSEDVEQAETEEAKPELPSTLDELAAAFDADPEWANSIKVKAKVDGEEVEVTLAEALNGYQRTADYTRKTTELAEQRKAFDAEAMRVEAELRQRAERFSTLTGLLERQLTGAEPDWARLQSNPQAYLQAQREWSQKVAVVKQAAAQRDALVQQQQAQTQAEMAKFVEAERQKMVTNWPELADIKGPKVSALTGYLKEKGFSDSDIAGLVDHRMIGVLMDAVHGRQVETAAPEKKMVKPKATHTVKPGTPVKSEDARTARMDAARRNAKRNPKSMDAHAERLRLILG